MRRFIWRYRVARFKFTTELNLVPSSGRSRRLKFERNNDKAKYFCARRGTFKFGDGSYYVGNDRAKFKSNEV